MVKRVRFRKALVGPDLSYRPGEVCDIDGAWADNLAEGGVVDILDKRETATNERQPERAVQQREPKRR